MNLRKEANACRRAERDFTREDWLVSSLSPRLRDMLGPESAIRPWAVRASCAGSVAVVPLGLAMPAPRVFAPGATVHMLLVPLVPLLLLVVPEPPSATPALGVVEVSEQASKASTAATANAHRGKHIEVTR